MKKYYIEFVTTKTENPYSMQSKWFDTKKEAYDWLASSFDHINKEDITVYLMYAWWDLENNSYEDIGQEKVVEFDYVYYAHMRGEDYNDL